MKNATKHAQGLKGLVKSLCEKYDTGSRPPVEPLRAVVLGVLREGASEAAVEGAVSVIDDEYVDLNELRVATELELADMLSAAYPGIASHQRAEQIKAALTVIFEVEGRLSLERIAALGKREQRPAMSKIAAASHGAITPYIEAHVALLAFGIGTVPLDGPSRDYLTGVGVLDEEASEADCHKFVEQNLKADECWAFFAACRAEAYAAHQRAGKKSAGRTAKASKPTKKTAKRTVK